MIEEEQGIIIAAMHRSLQQRLDEVSNDMKLQGQVFAEEGER